MKHPIRRRFMYLGFLGLQGFARVVPLSFARALGLGLGLMAWLLLRKEARLTQQHLAYAFGDTLPSRTRRHIARRVFMNLGQTAMEWLVLPRLSQRALERLIVAEGIPHLREALAKGNGAIIVTAHFGNWEVMPLYLGSLGFRGAVLARRLRYPEYESFLIAARGRRGVPTLARGSVKEVARLLRANQIVGMLPDQDMDSLEGVFVNFLGHPAYTPLGPAALSAMTQAPILPCLLMREGARFRLVVEPPLTPARTGDRSHDLTALTQAWSDVLASYIRRFPEQWVWMHRRWKTQQTTDAAQGSRLKAEGKGLQPHQSGGAQPVLAALLLTAGVWLMASLIGCGKAAAPTSKEVAPATDTTATNADQQMSSFTLTGYQPDGSKRWELEGQGAQMEGRQVTILHPRAIGYDPQRTSHLTASAALVQQANRRVRLEHDVTVHTSDGVWFTTPALYWTPDQNQMTSEMPVRIETDHMLLRGRGAEAQTQLKHARVLSDVEVVLNPSDHEPAAGTRRQVIITCDGPLSMDYERHIATFEQNVHVNDPNGDLFSDKLVAYFDERTRTIRYAEATGRVRVHQHENTAESDRAVYEPAIGKITLLGRPSLLLYPDSSSAQPPSFSDLTVAAPGASANN